MEKLTEKELFARLKHFNISKIELLNAIRCSYSYPENTFYGEVIDQSLVWMDTPQGHDFWKDVCDNIDEIEISFKNQINKIKIK